MYNIIVYNFTAHICNGRITSNLLASIIIFNNDGKLQFHNLANIKFLQLLKHANFDQVSKRKNNQATKNYKSIKGEESFIPSIVLKSYYEQQTNIASL